jgi:purine-nucleoside/S-methyl-5'-thioadenosine phosphorylase / adenosine deaminase
MRWRESEGVRWLEAELPGARVAFSTRGGGTSAGPFESLNLGVLTGDDVESVYENRRRLARALGLSPDGVVVGLQVHGAELAAHAGPQRPSAFAEPVAAIPEVDGHVVSEPGPAALVFVADCLPVALAGPGGVAMLHCGWRGLAAGIVARGVAAVAATHAAIGPGIGPCCYEVGDEVLSALASPTSREATSLVAKRPTGGRSLDLPEVARQLLSEAGVETIESANLCTSCEEGSFFSHRRDAGETGRQAGLVWLTGQTADKGLSR